MKLLNKFIDWKRNIENIQYFNISLYFDSPQVNFDTIKAQVFSLFPLIEDELLRRKLMNAEIQFERRDVDGYYFVNFDDLVDAKKLKKNLPSFSLARTSGVKKEYEWVVCNFKMNSVPIELLAQLALIKGLHLMFVNNTHYSSWENKNRLLGYKYRRGLENIHYSKMQGTYVHDISSRPGRYSINKYFRFAGASEYWFGDSFFERNVSKKSLLSFGYANLVKELPNGFVYIKLFELKDYWLDDSQNKLRKLREFIKIDQIEIKNPWV